MVTPSSRAILAANLRRMIDADGGSVRAWAMGKRLDVRMVDRLVKEENSPTLDTLDEIAAACGLRTWQMLLEDVDATRPPDANVTMDERVAVGEHSDMLTIHQIRAVNLRELLREIESSTGSSRGVLSELARRTTVPTSQISQVLNERLHTGGKARQIGDNTARKLERGMAKPLGWMDRLHGAPEAGKTKPPLPGGGPDGSTSRSDAPADTRPHRITLGDALAVLAEDALRDSANRMEPATFTQVCSLLHERALSDGGLTREYVQALLSLTRRRAG
jgi:transcriptional regulator with XRE-family HTH domain